MFVKIFSYVWRHTDLDTKKEREFTWAFVMFCLWPQYQAFKLVKRIFTLKRTGIYRDNEDLKRQTQVCQR